MLLRVLLLSACAGIFSIHTGYANPDENKENQDPSSISVKPGVKRKSVEEEDKLPPPPTYPESQGFSPIKKHKKSKLYEGESGLSSPNPSEASENALSPFRRTMILKKKVSDPNPVSSPDVRKILNESHIEDNFVKERVCGKFVWQNDYLFNPYAWILNDKFQWETNLARMEIKGGAPIGHAGSWEKPIDLTRMTDEEKTAIYKRQLENTIDLHHVTQKDTGLPDDPILELLRSEHKGTHSYYILKGTPPTIVHLHLTKEEAIKILTTEQAISEQWSMVGDGFHFRKGASLIIRNEWDRWRKKYWEYRAQQIKGMPVFPRTPPAQQKKVYTKLNARRQLF